jgi:hypothetical protein
MENEGYKAFKLAHDSVKKGGVAVFLLYTPEGQRGHYYAGRFGMKYGGRDWSPGMYYPMPSKIKTVIAVTPHHSVMDEFYYGKESIWVKSWAEALEELYTIHSKREKPLVAVYPCATIQISEKNATLL